MTETLEQMLIRHEGLRLFPYRCPQGALTIGVGRNLDANGISKEEAMRMLGEDIRACERDLEQIFGSFNQVFGSYRRKDATTRVKALIDMRFQLGASGFRSFSSMIQAIKDKDWNRAADEALNSLWAQQTPERAREIAGMIRHGGE